MGRPTPSVACAGANRSRVERPIGIASVKHKFGCPKSSPIVAKLVLKKHMDLAREEWAIRPFSLHAQAYAKRKRDGPISDAAAKSEKGAERIPSPIAKHPPLFVTPLLPPDSNHPPHILSSTSGDRHWLPCSFDFMAYLERRNAWVLWHIEPTYVATLTKIMDKASLGWMVGAKAKHMIDLML
jgi:hypothetical protein